MTKGDIITWLREMDKMSCPEAHEAAGLPCRAQSCPARGTCRFGDGSGATRRHVRSSVAPLLPPSPKALAEASAAPPSTIWAQWAEAEVKKRAEALAKNTEELAWLAARGINSAAAQRFRLGWRSHDSKAQRSLLGLSLRDGKETIWIPDGLVIPILSPTGVHRIRIRRPEASRGRFLPDLKYYWLEGSGSGPMVIEAAGVSRGAVVVEAELDAMAIATAHAEVTVIALGSASAGVPAGLRAELAAQPVVLVALDADPGREGRKGAGPAAVAAWLREWRQARFWPVPAGKDPGDYVASHHGDLAAWIEAGLPPRIAPTPAPCPPPSGPALEPVPEPGDALSGPVAITLADGKIIYLARAKEEWTTLVAAGKIVFSENELKRLKAAMAACGPDGAAQMLNAVIAAKAVFDGAYIRRGGVAIHRECVDVGQ